MLTRTQIAIVLSLEFGIVRGTSTESIHADELASGCAGQSSEHAARSRFYSDRIQYFLIRRSVAIGQRALSLFARSSLLSFGAASCYRAQ